MRELRQAAGRRGTRGAAAHASSATITAHPIRLRMAAPGRLGADPGDGSFYRNRAGVGVSSDVRMV